jgi:glucose/arabinose dehydrogenase
MADAGERTTVTDNIPAGGAHTSRTLHFGPDGKLYVAAGSSGNNGVEDDWRRAAIMRFNPDGSIPPDNPFANDPQETRRPVWAEGLRNSVDFLWLPDGRLWANHNGSDGLGDDLPPEEIVIQVEKGKHYGWP